MQKTHAPPMIFGIGGYREMLGAKNRLALKTEKPIPRRLFTFGTLTRKYTTV